MAKYLIQGNYVSDGVKGLLQEGGTGRREAVEKLVGSLGGSLESLYFAFGDSDIVAIVDMPDHASVSAAALMVGATGAVTLRTTVLITPEEVDEATKKTPAYRAPGQ